MEDTIQKQDIKENLEENSKIGKKTRKTRKVAQPLPDARMNLDKQIKILRAICAASDKGSKYASPKEIAPLANVHDTEASGVCSFFLRLDMLERNNFQYKPKEALVTFCNNLEWEPETAGNYLKEEFSKTWFGESVINFFKVNKEATKENLIKTLGKVAQADSYHKKALSLLVDFLQYANILDFDESSKKYGIVNGLNPSLNEQIKINPPKGELESNISEPISEKTPELKSSENPKVKALININIDVKFTDDTNPEELAKKIKRFKQLIK